MALIMALIFYMLGASMISIVWLISIVAVWARADENFGGSTGKGLGISFAIMMSIVTFLAFESLNNEACSNQLDLEICDE